MLALIDPSDEQYNVQRALVDGDAAFYITELLSDPSANVRAAEAVAAVCRHSAPSMARLAAGPLVGLDSSVERVSLNPCQSGACFWQMLRRPLGHCCIISADPHFHFHLFSEHAPCKPMQADTVLTAMPLTYTADI